MIYVFLANGFEETEAIAPIDILRRSELKVTTVGIGEDIVVSSHGIAVVPDITEVEFVPSDDIDMIVLPGGMPGTLNLAASATVIDAIDRSVEADSYIAAICAAPSILGDMGLLKGKEAICYPGFEGRLAGATVSQSRVVLDGKYLTAAGMGAALDMGIKIVEIFCGADKAAALRHAVIAD